MSVPTQIRHAADVCPTRDQDDDGRTLEYGGQHNQPAASFPFSQNAGAADREIRFTASNRLGDIDLRAGPPSRMVTSRPAPR
jgi:hypothetical protein